MLRHTRILKITKVNKEYLESFYKVMLSINDLYTLSPAPIVQVSIIKNQEEGITVELNTYGDQREFTELCTVYEGLLITLESFS